MRQIGKVICGCVSLGFLILLFAPQAVAERHTVKVAVAHRGLVSTTLVFALGQNAGLYKKEGVNLKIVWTRGGGETVRAVATGSTDFAHDTGLLGVLAAYARKAPLKIVMAAATGNEQFWYVKAGSPIHSLKDMTGKTLGYSEPGSSTNMAVLEALAASHVQAKPVAIGSPPDSYTAVMTGQVTAGWSAAPFFLKQVQEGKIRILFKAADFPQLENLTSRVMVANSNFLRRNPRTTRAFLAAFRKTINYMYAHRKVTIDTLAKLDKLPTSVAVEALKFFPKKFFSPRPLEGLEYSMRKAVEFKFIKKPLTKKDLHRLIDFRYLPH